MPTDVRISATDLVTLAKELGLAENRIILAEGDHGFGEAKELFAIGIRFPIFNHKAGNRCMFHHVGKIHLVHRRHAAAGVAAEQAAPAQPRVVAALVAALADEDPSVAKALLGAVCNRFALSETADEAKVDLVAKAGELADAARKLAGPIEGISKEYRKTEKESESAAAVALRAATRNRYATGWWAQLERDLELARLTITPRGVVGLALGGTFLIFSDYLKPAIRIAAISKIPVVYVFTHDSIGVGEDGPTHQPIEQLAMLRAIPNLDVIRPAGANETLEAWKAAITDPEQVMRS